MLPDQWHDEYIDPIDWRREFQWSRVILKRALSALRTRNRIRICLFIDGMDEYDNAQDEADNQDKDYQEIISILTSLSESTNIKICLSSRPWLVFEDAFRSFANLKLQDLTFYDITQYVNDKIDGHPRIQELKRIDP